MKNLFVMVLLFVATGLNAQFKIGVGAGLNFTRLAQYEIPENAELNGAAGLNAGVIMEYKFTDRLGMEVDVLFSRKGFKEEYNFEGIVPEFPFLQPLSSETDLSYIDLPVVLKWYVLDFFNLQGGLQYSHILRATGKIEGVGDFDVKDGFNSIYMSVPVGLGVDVSWFHFSFRFVNGLTKLISGSDARQHEMMFNVGFWIKK